MAAVSRRRERSASLVEAAACMVRSKLRRKLHFWSSIGTATFMPKPMTEPPPPADTMQLSDENDP
ncbi:hypothetical protein D3C86_730350 [compost metagenome]